jgi:hypothetical protein
MVFLIFKMDIFKRIAERKIQEAMEEGLFDNLPGRGKPLEFEDETWIPEDLRIAYRLLKNAGYIPPELELRNEIMNLRSLIDTLDDDKERLKKLRELNYKFVKFNMMKKRPLMLEDYENRVIEKLIS